MLENTALYPVLTTAGTGALIVLSIIANWWGRARPPKPAEPAPSRDVMIPSIAVADGQLIAEQVKVLRETNDHYKDRQLFERQMLDLAKDNMALEREKITVQREILVFTKQMADHLSDCRASLERIERNQNPPSPSRR